MNRRSGSNTMVHTFLQTGCVCPKATEARTDQMASHLPTTQGGPLSWRRNVFPFFKAFVGVQRFFLIRASCHIAAEPPLKQDPWNGSRASLTCPKFQESSSSTLLDSFATVLHRSSKRKVAFARERTECHCTAQC